MSGKAMEIFVYFTPALERLVSVFQIILNMSLYAAVVILLVAAVRFIMRKKFPAWFAYALWGIVLLRLVLPVGLLTSSFSVFNLEESIRTITGHALREERAAKTATETAEAPVPAIDYGTSSPPPGTVTTKVDEGVIVTVSVTPSPELIAALIWITGLTAFLLFAVIAHSKTLRRLRFAVKFEKPELMAECAKQAGLRRPIQIVSSDIYGSPVVCGLIKPKIVLPMSLENAEPDILRAMLTHELNHIKRFDLLWNLLGTLALAVHWFNPFVWMAAVLSRRDRERSCDERTLSILGDNKQYAETLLTISALQSGVSAPIGALAFGEEGVKGRIKSALSFQKKGRLIVLTAGLLLGITSAALATSAAPVGTVSLRQAKSIVAQELRLQYPNEKMTDFKIFEQGTDEIFQATGLQIFKIVSGFGENDAFVVKEGFVVHSIPGRGGYGVNDIQLSDFNGDGKKELLCTGTNTNGKYGMMSAYVDLYDPWERMSIGTGPSVSVPIYMTWISDEEFILHDGDGEYITHLTNAPGKDAFPYSLKTEPIFGTDNPSLYVSAYPNPYTPAMSSSPGMRIDVSYNVLYSGVRYQADGGAFLAWDGGEVTILGSDVTRLNGHSVYWYPVHGEEITTSNVTVTILYDTRLDDPYTPENILAETILPITYDGVGWYSIGEGTAPPPSSSPGIVGGANGQ